MASRAKAIRASLQQLGVNASFKAIQQHLTADGITVSPQQVSNEKRKLRTPYNIKDLPVSVLKRVKKLADEVGSVAILRRALDELESLGTLGKE